MSRHVPRGGAVFETVQWQVPAGDIRRRSIARRCSPAVVVSPRYDSSRPTRLDALRGGEAVVLLAENSFNFKDDGHTWLPVLGAIASQCPCFRLSVADLDTACRLIIDLLEPAPDAG